MEQFFINPGLSHIGENILMNLDCNSLILCRIVCQTWKIILDNPRFWLKLCFQKVAKIPLKLHIEWKELILKTEDTNLKQNVTFLLMKMYQKPLQTPLYMALKVKDFTFVEHLLLQHMDQFMVNNGHVEVLIQSMTKNGHVDVMKQSMDNNNGHVEVMNQSMAKKYNSNNNLSQCLEKCIKAY